MIGNEGGGLSEEFLALADAEASRLLAHAQSQGASDLAAPRKIVRVPEIPVLGTGKTDYVAIQRMVEAEPKAA